ncbi:MAG: hypothetical protein OEM67_03055 [Thermoleophilia bacterium]|nr:hypothetical protein [Thermoleophilia bacterium]MDH3725613.1 hypothetical protein [Thermoleophilia bacterium]
MNALTRTLIPLVAIAAALLALPLTAHGGGADVISDYNDNGQIDRCYTLSEYDAATTLLGEDDPQYGETLDAIQDARLANVVAQEGDPCPAGTPPATGDSPEVDEGGSGGTILAIVLVIAAVGAVGAGLLVRARSGAASQ